MNTYVGKTPEKKGQVSESESAQLEGGGELTFQMTDNRPEAVGHRNLQAAANNSRGVSQLRALQAKINNSPQVRQTAQLQAMANNRPSPQQPIQKAKNDKEGSDNPEEKKSNPEVSSGTSEFGKDVYNTALGTASSVSAYAAYEGSDTGVGGANLGLGALRMNDAKNMWQEGDKAGAVATGMGGAGQTITGGTRLAKGIGLLKGGDVTTWTKVGDIGSSIGNGLSCVSGMITTFKGVKDAWAARESSTTSEKVDSVADAAGGVIGVASSGVTAARDVIKVGSEVGGQGFGSLSAGQATQTIANMTQAAAIMGVISGSIQIIHGAYQAAMAFKRSGNVQKVQDSITSALISLATDKIPELESEKKKYANELSAKSQSGEANGAELMAQGEAKMNEIVARLEVLKESLTQLEAFYNEYGPTMSAMRKIQSRNMERAGLKMAGGAVAVTSSALLLSGVGAPVSIGVAAIGGIIALGNAAVQYSRNKAAKRAFGVASKLDDSGQPMKKAEPAELSYRTMESRMFKNYYRNLKRTMSGEKSFPGLTKDETTDVKHFGWDDKKARLKSENRYTVYDINEVDGIKDFVKRERWIQVENKNKKGKVTHTEKPKGMTALKLRLSGSAHKSKVSMEASASEIAEALYDLGMGSFSNGKVVDCKVNPLDDGSDAVDMKSLKDHTSATLLKAADITGKKWDAWLKSTEGDAEKMKEQIKKHVSR